MLGLKFEAPPPPASDLFTGPTAYLNYMLYSFHLGIFLGAPSSAPPPAAEDPLPTGGRAPRPRPGILGL